ncbi:hypothetical protein F2Q69_00055500 [Brassica cretica]|uniref:Uncharacterized protein n=1 Tax=Brassica cretica TaxID=69181 RepID=A0A8S9MZE0_BRACR|nr:hypothetical protein F2Q69_00055500 [Brassica cretica]
MVSARLVDCPDSPDVQQSKSIPQMMFAAAIAKMMVLIRVVNLAKKQTLNLSHARNVNKKRDVVVTSILEDLERRLDDSALTWSDEEDDDTVDNMVDLINANHSFQLSLYVGGLTKADVDRMREASPPATKAKRSRKHLKNPLSDDQTSIASFVIGKVQPQLDVMGNTIKQSSSTLASIEGTVITRVESVLKKFKAECLRAVESMVAVLCKDYT